MCIAQMLVNGSTHPLPLAIRRESGCCSWSETEATADSRESHPIAGDNTPVEWISTTQPKKPRRRRKREQQLTTDGVDELEGYKATHVCGDNYHLDTANQPKRRASEHSILKHLRRVLLY